MTRPRCRYKIGFCPQYRNFKPVGIKGSCKCVEISPEEAEALRLKDIKGLEQMQAAEKMGISQSTFQRILASARRKLSEALLGGKEIQIAQEQKDAPR